MRNTGLSHVLTTAAAGPGAVVAGKVRHGFAELMGAAERLVPALETYAGQGAVVALDLVPSAGLVTAVMASVLSGSGYLYLDPAWPEPHRQELLDQSRASAVVRTSDSGELLVQLTAASRAHDVIAGVGAAVTTPDMACVISTSGTTGSPRLAALTHSGIMHLVRGDGRIRLRPGDRLLTLAHPGFGAFVWELWAALDGGADLVIPENRVMALHELADTIVQSRSTVVHLTAGLFRQFVPGHLDALADVRLVMTGGDTVPPAQFLAASRALAGDVVACYGCTENTVFTTLYQADGEFEAQAAVPLGRPLDGTRLHVLSASGSPVARGETGEIHVCGSGLVDGYLNDTEATAARFSTLDGVRSFGTGDFARRLENDTYVLVGRRDRQVQVRGFRVELADVEHRFRSLTEVQDALCVQIDQSGGDSGLVVLLTCRAGAEFDAGAALSAVRGRVPDFMVPDRVVIIDALPLTERGKVDRDRVRLLLAGSGTVGAAERPAEDDIAGRIEAVWRRVLGLPSVPHGQSFTEAGGHSLRATQVLTRITEEFGVVVSLRDFYRDPTISGLARLVVAAAPGAGGGA
jgi:acyl-coenzyme A synthetase/AMP-(fatty) acid ligase